MSVDKQKPGLISELQPRFREGLYEPKLNLRGGKRLWSRVALGITTLALLAACDFKTTPNPPSEPPLYPSPVAEIVRDPQTRFEIIAQDETRYIEQRIKNLIKAGYAGSEKLNFEDVEEDPQLDSSISLTDWVSMASKVTSFSGSRRINSYRGNNPVGDAIFSLKERTLRLQGYQLDLYKNTDDFSFRGDVGKDPTLAEVKELVNIPDSVIWKQYQPNEKGEVITGWIHGLSKGPDGSITIVTINNSGEVLYKFISAQNPGIKDFEDSFEKLYVPKPPAKIETGEIEDAKASLKFLKATFLTGGADSFYDTKKKDFSYSRNFDTLEGWLSASSKLEYDDKTSINRPNGTATFMAEDHQTIFLNGADLTYTEGAGLDDTTVSGSFTKGHSTTINPSELPAYLRYFDINIQKMEHRKLRSSDFPDNEGIVVNFKTQEGLDGTLIIDKYLHFSYSIDYNTPTP